MGGRGVRVGSDGAGIELLRRRVVVLAVRQQVAHQDKPRPIVRIDAQAVVDEVVSKQLFKAHTSELLPGGDYKLVVKSRAGDAGGPLQTSFRKVKYLRVADPEPEPGPEPEPEPLAQTSDGKCKVTSFKDGDSATEFTFGNEWTLTGQGFYDDNAPEGEWSFSEASIRVGAEQATFICNVGMDGTSVTLTKNPEFSIYAGEYENVALEYTVFRGMESETLTLTIPRLVVT